MRAEEGALAVVRFTLDQRKGEVAAEDHAAGAGQAVGQALRNRADPGNRHDAERDAGDKDAEAAQSAAQLAPGETQRERGHFLLATSGCSIRPECMCSTRLQRAASAVSWVTSTKRRAVLVMAAKQKLDDLSSGRFIEIAGRLVGDDDRGIGHERAGERNALLLAAGQLGRVMVEPAAQSDRRQLVLGARECVARAGEFERHRDVFQRCHGRDQVEGLEHDADIPAAKAREFILIELAQVLSGNDDRTAVGPLQSGHHHEQRRLAGTRRSKEGHGLAASYIQADVFEDMNAGGGAAERQIDPAQRDGVASERMPRRVIHVSG